MTERIRLEDGPNKLSVAFEQLVEHLTIIDVVAALWSNCWWSIMQQLILLDWLDVHLLIECLIWC